MSIQEAKIQFLGDRLTGPQIFQKQTVTADMQDFYLDKEAARRVSAEKLYEVEAYFPVENDTEGGLFFGITRILHGKIGTEYYMTKGHFHARDNRGEFYWCISGEGMLLLMDRNRNTRAERMTPGSLHYIPGHTAHRVANTGNTMLSFGACWPSDAGYDYEEIASNGFSARLHEVNGNPELQSHQEKKV